MYKDSIFQELKKEIISRFEDTSLEDFSVFHEWILPHLDIIKNLNSLPSISTSTPLPSQPLDDDIKNDDQSESKENSPYPVNHIFEFSKKASGGLLEQLNYPLPESVVQSMELENGNMIRITGIRKKFYDKSPMYDFEVVDRTSLPNPALIEIKKGFVEMHGSRLIVQSTDHGLIWMDDLPVCLYINEKDSNKFDIKPGDIIDGRFYSNNIVNSFRVNRKYEIENPTQESVESKRLQHRQNNATERESGFSMMERLDTTPFQNKTILLCGLESRVNDFKENIAKTDIQFVHLTGDEHSGKIVSKLSKADYVLISTRENSHDAGYEIVDICKEYHIPYTSTHADGLFGVLMDAKELIENTTRVH